LAIIKCLIDITKRTNVFIPVASYLLEIFESSELKSKPKPSTLKPLDFTLNIRAPNAYLGTKTYHLGLVEQVINHLYDFYASCSLSISFPELSVPAIIQLKRMTKSKDFSMNKQIQQLIEKVLCFFDFSWNKTANLLLQREHKCSLDQKISRKLYLIFLIPDGFPERLGQIRSSTLQVQ
jgi:hypothetical protein